MVLTMTSFPCRAAMARGVVLPRLVGLPALSYSINRKEHISMSRRA